MKETLTTISPSKATRSREMEAEGRRTKLALRTVPQMQDILGRRVGWVVGKEWWKEETKRKKRRNTPNILLPSHDSIKN